MKKKKIEARKFFDEQLENVLFQRELEKFRLSLDTPSIQEHKQERKDVRKETKEQIATNYEYLRTVEAKTALLSENLKTALLKMQDNTLKLHTHNLVQYTEELTRFTNQVIQDWDTNREPRYTEIRNNIILTTCRIKHILDATNKKLAKDKQLVTILENLWYSKWWKDKEIKAVMTFVKEEQASRWPSLNNANNFIK
jgi:hypothetical protein